LVFFVLRNSDSAYVKYTTKSPFLKQDVAWFFSFLALKAISSHCSIRAGQACAFCLIREKIIIEKSVFSELNPDFCLVSSNNSKYNINISKSFSVFGGGP